MQYTASKSEAPKDQSRYEDEQFNIEFNDLYQAFASVSDPRRAQGRVYWLPSLLCLAVAAILCNCLSVLAIAEWACGLSPDFRQALGLPNDRSPDQSTLHRLFRRLDPHQLSSALAEYFERASSRPSKQGKHLRTRAEQAVAVDGKTRKGQLQFEADNGHPTSLGQKTTLEHRSVSLSLCGTQP